MKRRSRGPTGPDIRDVKPTIILFDSKLTINGGSLADPEIGRVWHAIEHALRTAAFKNGLSYSWTAEFSCTTPTRMAARIERLNLNVETPPAADAGATAVTTGAPESAHESSS